MEVLKLTTTINQSGYLNINIPTQLATGEVNVVVVLNPVSSGEKQQPSYDFSDLVLGTRTSVRSIIGLWRLGVMPEEILNHLPHLTLAQIFDALSFYLDHQAEINRYIEQNRVPDELVHPLVREALGKS